MKPIFSTATLLALSFALSTLQAGDINRGKAKVKAVCQTCHGVDGISTQAGVPNLAGQKEDYIIIQLQAFRTSRREHAQMSIIAQMLSDEDIDNVASWYSSIKISPQLPQ